MIKHSTVLLRNIATTNHHANTIATGRNSTVLLPLFFSQNSIRKFTSSIVHSSFRGKLLTDHFKIVPSSSDGNCLYESLSKSLQGTTNHLKMRLRIIEWMRNNLDTKIDGLELKHALFLDYEGQPFDEYLDNLSKEGTFGDFSSIVVASRLFPNVAFRILIVSARIVQSEVIEVNPETTTTGSSATEKASTNNNNKEVWLSYDEQLKHYDLIIPLK